jgi:hypothetical protein
VWNPIPLETQGSNFRTHSVFINDNWRVSNTLTANLGLRWDRNDGRDQAGTLVAKDAAFSPRLGIIWDPTGEGRWSVTASAAKYVASISNPIADSGSAGGNPQTRTYVYRGPNINPAGAANLVPSAQALRQLFDWFFANGGSNLPLNGPALIPGVTPIIGDRLASPHSWEVASGVSRQFGNRAAVRADFTYRTFGNMYVRVANTATGRTRDSEGSQFDLSLIQNDTEGMLERQYAGFSLQSTYRAGAFDVGGNYTVSRAWGNVDGENVNSGPLSFDYRYPEYKQASWNFPVGDLAVDQRHRARLWLSYNPGWATGLVLSVLEHLESGVPYGASTATGVDPRPFVTNPGYLTPSSGTQTTYYFGPRDEFRTEKQVRTDLAINYAHRVRGSRAELFGQMQILNVFNQFQLCGCGGTIFGTGSSRSAGGVDQTRIDQTILTAVTAPARFQTFNPFTTTPVRGTHWDYGQLFGQALNRNAHTTPLSMRLTFGVRF